MIDCLSTGKDQQLLITFAKEARKRGFKLGIISLSEDDASAYHEQFQALGAAVYFFPTKRIFDFKNLYRITKLFWSEKPGISFTRI